MNCIDLLADQCSLRVAINLQKRSEKSKQKEIKQLQVSSLGLWEYQDTNIDSTLSGKGYYVQCKRFIVQASKRKANQPSKGRASLAGLASA